MLVITRIPVSSKKIGTNRIRASKSEAKVNFYLPKFKDGLKRITLSKELLFFTFNDSVHKLRTEIL